MTEHQKTAVFDFDGVIAEYDSWQGVDKFGPPLPGVREALLWFKGRGWRIVIWTTRKATQRLGDYLDFHGLPYDAINDASHNPEDAGQSKPIGDIYFDDRDWNSLRRPWNWRRVMRRVRQLYPDPRPLLMDDDL